MGDKTRENKLRKAAEAQAIVSKERQRKAVTLGAAFLAVVLFGFILWTSNQWQVQASETPAPASATIRVESTKTTTANFVSQAYPEVSNLPIRSHGEFSTRFGHKIDWFNLSETEFDPEGAKQVFDYFEWLGLQDFPFSFEAGDSTKVEVALGPDPTWKRTSLFVVPESAPRPKWMTLPEETTLAITSRDIATGEHTSIIWVTDSKNDPTIQGWFPTAPQQANESLNVEACQNAVLVRVNSSRHWDAAQEGTCISWGLALALRQEGVDPNEYSSFASQHSAKVGETIAPYLVWDANEFLKLPLFPKAIR